MISDEERREVAERLRSASARRSDAPWMVEDLMLALGFRCYEDGEDQLFDRLADLIDRPSCFDTESKDSKSFTCSACGFSESKLVISPFTLSFLWVKPSYRYCPRCGAEVVE